MEKHCSVCQTSKPGLRCGICSMSICKSCALFVDEELFPFLAEAPANLHDLTACGPCFDHNVAPILSQHQEIYERAKMVEVYMKEQGKETRLIKRKNRPLRVDSCRDQDEALMRLAFQAAKMDCDMLVDVDLIAKKIHDHAYQTKEWSGQAVPVRTEKSFY